MRHRCYWLRLWVAALPLVGSVAFTACEKENLDGKIVIQAEKLGNGKVAMEGRSSTWVDGELIRINDKTKTVSVTDDVATIDNSVESLTAPYNAIYPAAICPDADLSGAASIDITLPDEYHYSESGGTQHIDIPMAAHSDGNTLQFKHLGGALTISVINRFGAEMSLDEITVESSTSQICGVREVVFANITGQSANDAEVTDAQKKVRMLFDSPLAVANDTSKNIVIPVLPVSSSNKFTIHVTAICNGKHYSFSKTQNTGGALQRNEMGFVPVEMSATSEDVSLLVSSVTDYNSLVTYINGLTAGSTTLKISVDGTIDFGGASVTPINANANTIIFEGKNNATIKNLTMTGVSNCYGLTYSFNPSSNITFKDVTVEDITLPGNNVTICYLGAFCAYTKGNITLDGCTAKNVSIGQASQTLQPYFGGLVGYLFVSNTNTLPLIANIRNCNFIQDASLVNPSITKIDSPVIGGIIGQIMETDPNTIQLIMDNCVVKNSSDGSFGLSLSLVSGSYHLNLGGLIGYCKMPSIMTIFTNLQIKNCSSKINFTIEKTTSNNLYIGGMIGQFSGNNTSIIPTSDYWSGNTVTGSIQYRNNGSNNHTNAVVGYFNGREIDDWSGLATTNVTITNL
ncbi:MAG: hypothetical protein IKN84_03220 [Bacteroidales bacterium]|nr:hypothetical protein [Bacteroidales bacterium]